MKKNKSFTICLLLFVSLSSINCRENNSPETSQTVAVTLPPTLNPAPAPVPVPVPVKDIPDSPFTDLSSTKISYRVVSLKNAENRRKTISSQFDTMNFVIDSVNQVNNSVKQDKISFSFIDAILGRELDKQSLVDNGYFKLGSLNDGELGLVRTTTEHILPLAAADGEALTVIFEDDVVLASDLDYSFRQALRMVPPDWDILYLGCFQNAYCSKKVFSPFTPPKYAIEKERAVNLCPDTQTQRVAGTNWMKIGEWCVPGTWAYAINSASANRITEAIHGIKPLSLPIDEIYRTLGRDKKLNIYCLNPELVRPNYALPSTIR